MSFTYNDESQIINKIVMDDAIDNLTEKQRVVLALRVADYQYKESADIMGITLGKYAWILRKTRKALRHVFGGSNGTLA